LSGLAGATRLRSLFSGTFFFLIDLFAAQSRPKHIFLPVSRLVGGVIFIARSVADELSINIF
jgi:hypothetical protein